MGADTIDDMPLGDNIRALRERRGMSPKEMAEHLGVSVQAVSQWETGKTKALKQKNLEGICDLFSVRIEDLRARRLPAETEKRHSGEEMVEKNLSLTALRVGISILRPDLALDEAQSLAAVFLDLALVPPDQTNQASYEDQLRSRYQGAVAALSAGKEPPKDRQPRS